MSATMSRARTTLSSSPALMRSTARPTDFSHSGALREPSRQFTETWLRPAVESMRADCIASGSTPGAWIVVTQA